MSLIDKYMKKASGNWIGAEDCVVGDRVKIITVPEIDDKTYDKPYLVCRVTLMRSGKTFNLRMGIMNVRRISETLGKDENTWTGRLLEVVSIEYYSGVGQKGLLLRGLQQELIQTRNKHPSLDQEDITAEAISVIKANKNLINLRYPLNRSDWYKLPANVRVNLAQNGLVQESDELIFFTEAAKKLLAD